MKKIIFAVLIAFSFCLINSGDAMAKREVKKEVTNHGDGSKTVVKTIKSDNGYFKRVDKIYDEKGKVIYKDVVINR